MKKPIMLGVALACATLVTGCGNPHEKMVKEMYAVVQSGNRDKADKFCEQNFAPGLESQLKYNKGTKKVFSAISRTKDPVSVEVVKSVEREGFKGSVLKARCADTVLYFVIGAEEGKDDKISLISDYDMWGVSSEQEAKAPNTTSASSKSDSGKKQTSTQNTAPTPNTSTAIKPLTPEQKVARLMAQLKKVLGNSIEVSVALASIQEKVDQVPGDYKTKCVLQEMFGLQNKIPGGVIPDLPDTNGNNALADYLKARDIGDVGTIMCMYHCLSDEEQASVAEEVRKMMK